MLQRAQCCRELNAAESSMLQRAQCYRELNATDNLRYKKAAKFSWNGKTTACNFQLSVILQEMCSAWRQQALFMNEYLEWMGMPWIAEEEIYRVRQWTTFFFNSALKAEKEAPKVELNKRFNIFTTKCFWEFLLTLKWNTEEIATSDETRCMSF